MARFRRAPADQVLAAKLGERCYQGGLLEQRPAVHLDYEIAIAIAREPERVCPFALAPAVPGLVADINLVRPSFVRPAAFRVHHNGHSLRSDARSVAACLHTVALTGTKAGLQS